MQIKFCKYFKIRSGQAAVLSVLAVFSMGLIMADGLTGITISNIKISKQITDSIYSYYVATAGVEDALLRELDEDMVDIDGSHELLVGSASVETTVAEVNNIITATAVSNYNNKNRSLKASLGFHESTANFSAGVQVGEGGLTVTGNANIIGDVISGGDIIGSTTTVTGNIIVADGLANKDDIDTVSSVSTIPFTFANNNNALRDIAQKFTTPTGSPTVVGRVDIFVGKVLNPTDLIVHITTDNSGSPRNTDIAQETLSINAISPAGGWVSVTFDNPPTVSANTPYWVVLDSTGNSATTYYYWKSDNDGSGSGKTTSTWSSIGANWASQNKDFAMKVWLLPVGQSGKIVKDMIATGEIQANGIYTSTANSLSCPNWQNDKCKDSTAPMPTYPLDEDKIIKIKAEVGDIVCSIPDCINGDLTLNNDDAVTIGNMIIDGNLSVSGNAILTLTGPIWVKNNFSVSGGSVVKLDNDSYESGYGEYIVVGDGENQGDVAINGNGGFEGTGTPGSAIGVINTKNDIATNATRIENYAQGDVLFFAPNSCIRMSNGAEAMAMVGKCVRLQNQADILYDSALSKFTTSTQFTANTYYVSDWIEIE